MDSLLEHVFQSKERITRLLLNYMLPWTWQYAIMMLSSVQLYKNIVSPSPIPLRHENNRFVCSLVRKLESFSRFSFNLREMGSGEEQQTNWKKIHTM